MREHNIQKRSVRRRTVPHMSRFMAMSKLIGIVAFCFLLAIVVYAMVEMHINQNLENMGQLIISSFAFASIYAGFYLTMAKVEHVEEERSLCKKELETLRNQGSATEEDMAFYNEQLRSLQEQINNILSQEIHSVI